MTEAPLTGVAGRPLSSRGAQTRRRLLEAAEEVFADLGYHDASIVKLTEAAGVGQGTFYLYFSSKKEIFDELVLDLNHRVRQAMTEAATHGTTRAEREVLGFTAFFHFTAEHPALYRIIRQAEFANGDPEVLAWALMGIGELVGMRWILWAERDELPPAVAVELAEIIRRAIGSVEGKP